MTRTFAQRIPFLFLLSVLVLTPAPLLRADDGSFEAAAADDEASEPGQSLGQFPGVEVAPAPRGAQALPAGGPSGQDEAIVERAMARSAESGAKNAPGIDFPKVRTAEDEELAKRFAWWPTDAKPAPVKDPDRSGYWWWPEVPGEARPWGNQGYVYVLKIIFDYKEAEGEMKPSLVIKRIIKNVKVFFDYDKSVLRDDAVSALDKALYTLEHNEKADILITGNADVRGSEQYNQKLGERRADSVQRYLLDKGLPEDRIRILSRGKLDALAPTNDLEGMQKDRNAQFVIAEVEEVMIPASKAHLFQDKIVEEERQIEGEVRVDVKEYVIQEGDSLWKIAKREYGNGMQWKRLYEFNKDVISNPDRPRKGTKIRIPIE